MFANTHLFTLDPRDTMLVRDGRAMNANIGRSLPFPYPSTLAGVVRTRLGTDARGQFDTRRATQLRDEIAVSGPLLARLTTDGDRVADVLVHAPSDCVWFIDEAVGKMGHRLVPRSTQAIVAGSWTDLGDQAELADFEGPTPSGKPTGGLAFWSWRSLVAWLSEPASTSPAADVDGVDRFDRELRTHVTIDPATGVAEDGALFGTEAVRLVREETEELVIAKDEPKRVRRFDRYALLGAWSGPGSLRRGLVPLGGERRSAFLENLSNDACLSLDCPPRIAELQPGMRARVVLLTPAAFAEGAFPSSIAGASVVAAKVERPDVVSGWDFAANKPKPTRRLAPAGSVYWVEVPSATWAKNTWLTEISDDVQSRRDGFGLAAVGVA